MARRAADPNKDMPHRAAWVPVRTIPPFLQHLGIETLDFGYGGEGNSSGVYHSRYDTYEHHSRFVDPGFVYDALLAKTMGRVVLVAADSELPTSADRAISPTRRRNMSRN